MADTETGTIRLNLVLDELMRNWQTTPEIAKRLGVEWTPGAHGDLDEVRDDLYRLQLRGLAEHEERQNGHRWRLAEIERCPCGCDMRMGHPEYAKRHGDT